MASLKISTQLVNTPYWSTLHIITSQNLIRLTEIELSSLYINTIWDYDSHLKTFEIQIA